MAVCAVEFLTRHMKEAEKAGDYDKARILRNEARALRAAINKDMRKQRIEELYSPKTVWQPVEKKRG